MGRIEWIIALALSPLTAAITAASDAQTGAIPILTVCQALREHASYAGQTVIVVGRAFGSEDGTWLDESCGLGIVFADRTFPAAVSTSYDASETAPPPALPKGFKWDKRAIEKALAEVETTTHLAAKAYWCAVYGRLEVNPVRQIDLGNGRTAQAIGYGHGGAAAAQLVGPSDGILRLKGK
jgi:hypothetical protein